MQGDATHQAHSPGHEGTVTRVSHALRLDKSRCEVKFPELSPGSCPVSFIRVNGEDWAKTILIRQHKVKVHGSFPIVSTEPRPEKKEERYARARCALSAVFSNLKELSGKYIPEGQQYQGHDNLTDTYRIKILSSWFVKEDYTRESGSDRNLTSLISEGVVFVETLARTSASLPQEICAKKEICGVILVQYVLSYRIFKKSSVVSLGCMVQSIIWKITGPGLSVSIVFACNNGFNVTICDDLRFGQAIILVKDSACNIIENQVTRIVIEQTVADPAYWPIFSHVSPRTGDKLRYIDPNGLVG
uniref:Uncharacterized protein n=1 Tax=Timema bartmani TaxID=61472 RepID=A0A7R9HZP9_9NEOP|nr:unnamed protein product [Timema bartmani]